MKTRFVLIAFVAALYSFGQNALQAKDWQEDLRYLQSKIHKDHAFLFKKISAQDFDAEVNALYNQIPALEAHEIPVAFSRMVSLFKYGHTQIPFSTVAKQGVLPVNLYHFKDGIYVEGVQKPHQKALGAKVIKVEGIAVEEALAKIRPVVPVENDSYFNAYGLRFLTVPAVLHAQGVLPKWSENVTLTLEKNGKTFAYTFPTVALKDLSRGYAMSIANEDWLSARAQDSTPLYLKHLYEKFYVFDYLEDSKTLYVRQSSVFNDDKESLKDFYKRLFAFIDTNEVDKLIYDVRLNGGGNNYNNKPLLQGLMARPQINSKGKLFFIIGRYTFSACQNLVNEIDNYTEAIFVGEPTAENVNFYGDARPVLLPNSKIKAYLSYAWWQDKPQWENKDATLPHIAVDTSFEEYITNQDPVLEASLNYTDEGFILDPMQHLTDLFIAGQYEQLKRDAAAIAKNDQYRFYNFEDEFGKAGGRLLQNGNVEGSIFIFQLLTEIFPEAEGNYYNLGSALEQAQQKEKAIGTYKMLVKRFPEATLANAAKARIEALTED